MGVALTAFNLAREQRWIPRPLKEREQPDQAVYITKPVRRLRKLAKTLPRDIRPEATAVARFGGRASRQALEVELRRFERMKGYINYDWV